MNRDEGPPGGSPSIERVSVKIARGVRLRMDRATVERVYSELREGCRYMITLEEDGLYFQIELSAAAAMRLKLRLEKKL